MWDKVYVRYFMTMIIIIRSSLTFSNRFYSSMKELLKGFKITSEAKNYS